MKVIISVDSVRFPLTGIGRYTYELAQELAKERSIDELKLFNGRRFLSSLPFSDGKSVNNKDLRSILKKNPVAIELYRLLNPLLQSRALKQFDDHLFHGPNFYLPPFPGKKIATFHDLSPFKWAHCHDPVKVNFLQKELAKTLDNADALITDSEFTRQELAEFSGFPLNKIHTIPLACSSDFHPRSKKDSDVISLLDKYNLDYQGYTLFVGTIEPRKNILSLLDAYELLPNNVRKKWPLILTGYTGWQSEDIHQRIKQAESEGWARYLGYLPAKELPVIYSASRIFVFPSHYEGFGLPVLEAMSSGVPVVCSNSSSLPEVVGDAALMSSPLDVSTLAEHIHKALEDDIWRNEAIAKGLARSQDFSWSKCAKLTAEAYKKTL